MPFILITGLPSSGKTTVCNKLKEFFVGRNKKVEVVDESEILINKKLCRNTTYANSIVEKEIRGILKTEILRKLGPDVVLILDGLNYIKGFRYELYCATKSSKTTTCTIFMDPGVKNAVEYNLKRDGVERYEKDVFDGLVQRYEAPDSRNRWDSPLFLLTDFNSVPFGEIEEALYSRKAPAPNQSTQCAPLSDTNFLHQVDKSIQAIVTDIVSATKMGIEGEISVSGTSEKVLVGGEMNSTTPQLMRLKRQFLIYVKSHPDLNLQNIPLHFVQYLNTNL